MSVLFPHMPSDPVELVPYARLVRDTRARRLWQGQSTDVEPHQAFAHLAGAGYRVPVGTAVTLTVLRHPFEAAVQARSLAALTGHDTVLGVGMGDIDLVRGLLGRPYPSPLAAARDYLTILRELLDGSPVDRAGAEFSMHGELPSREHPGVAVGLGVLRPRMARLAGELADVAITWMTPPLYLRDVLLPEIRAGARAAGRPVPRVATVVHVAISREGVDPHRTALAGAGMHLQLPHYIDMLRRAGLTVHHSLPVLGARELVDSGTFVHGTADEVISALGAYAEAGVDEIVLNVSGVRTLSGADAALDDLQEILLHVAAAVV